MNCFDKVKLYETTMQWNKNFSQNKMWTQGLLIAIIVFHNKNIIFLSSLMVYITNETKDQVYHFFFDASVLSKFNPFIVFGRWPKHTQFPLWICCKT